MSSDGLRSRDSLDEGGAVATLFLRVGDGGLDGGGKVVTAAPGQAARPLPRSRMVTRSLAKTLPQSSNAAVGGILRCVCSAFLVSQQDVLLECSECRNWCHPACVRVDHVEMRQFLLHKSYRCPFCTGDVIDSPLDADNGGGGDSSAAVITGMGHSERGFTPSGAASVRSGVDEGSDGAKSPSNPRGAGRPCKKRTRLEEEPYQVKHPVRSAPVPRQTPLRLQEVPDSWPSGGAAAASAMRAQLRILTLVADESGFDLITLPDTELTDAMISDSIECCQEAIREATFSDSYPLYCLKEVRAARHGYVQGSMLRSKATGKVVSLILTNGMDVYGNLKPTLTQLRSALNRRAIEEHHITPFMRDCATLDDVSDFVHITLTSTHPQYQKLGLAKLLMAVELLRWALRGRSRAFLNMAIEKKLVDNDTRVVYVTSPASRGLYVLFGFQDVFPRFSKESGEVRWTPKEADMGRVMAQLAFVDTVKNIAGGIIAKHKNFDDNSKVAVAIRHLTLHRGRSTSGRQTKLVLRKRDVQE